MNDINIKICSKCGKELPLDQFNKRQSMCKVCHSDYNKQYRIDNKGKIIDNIKQYEGMYVYIIRGLNNEYLYAGKTTNYYTRFANHLCGNCPSTKEIFENNLWSRIQYLDVSDIVHNNEELKFLENTLIDIYTPPYNNVKNIIRNMDKLREFSLLSEFHDMNNFWTIHKENI